jgi:hypothetical protein
MRRYPRNRTAQLNRIVNALRDAPATERPAPPRTAFDVVDDLRRAKRDYDETMATLERAERDDPARPPTEVSQVVNRVMALVDEITDLVKR